MQPRLDASRTALLVIDVQRGFDEIEAAGLPRNNPDAVAQVARLLAAFRRAGAPVIHVRHASGEPDSRFRPERSGYAVRDEAREQAGEAVIVKEVNSAFIGTDLEQRLRSTGVETLASPAQPPIIAWRPPHEWPATWASGLFLSGTRHGPSIEPAPTATGIRPRWSMP
jgi:isochorismate hydrolase